MQGQYDAIIIGAGHNGLVTACYLARAGKKVLVLERRHVVGGACVTEEIFPGFKVSTAAYVNSLFRKEINDFKATTLKANVIRALSTQGDGAVLPLVLVRRYARRARDYLRAYAANPGPKEFKMIEKMKQHQKTRRSIFDLEFAFLGTLE